MIGLLYRTARETWLTTGILAVSMGLVTALLSFVLPQITQELAGVWMQMPLARNMISALLGVELSDGIPSRIMQGIIWVHPLVLAMTWTHAITLCTRVPAAEVDRGTIDVLLGLPVSRASVYLGETLVWIASGLIVIGGGVVGYTLATSRLESMQWPPAASILQVVVNLAALHLAVGGLASLASAGANRRGRAVAVVLAIVLASFLLNFLAQYWPPAQGLAFLGVLDYYRPAAILTSGAFPAGDVAVLLVVGVGAWAIGGVVFVRRSICTV